MNAYMNITVRVAAQQAQRDLNSLDARLKGMGSSGAAASGGLANFNRSLQSDNLIKFGKNLQWTGRQLEFNFTLPLVIAGGAAGRWAYLNEQAMTRVRAVYGAAGDDAGQLSAELGALGKSFELLSSRMGVNQQQVIEIGAEWAEAGVAGRALAEATKLTLEVMAVGGIDQEKAVTGLMAIQTAYRLNATQLRDAIATLAGVNKTGTITFAGLIDVVQRAGSSARAAGIDIQQLAAMADVLTPAAGSASQAGNALRTMISRLSAPTKQTVDIMHLMGIEVASAGFQAQNGFQKFVTLSGAFEKLTTSQKNLVASVIASRWQVNRFDILMDQIADHTSAFWRAMNETSDSARNMQIYMKMLNTTLMSSPQGLQIVTNSIKNSLASAMIDLVPVLTAVLSHVAVMINWFTNLDPAVQQLALMFLLATAALGPFLRYLGALNQIAGLGLKLINFLVIAVSREAAANVVAAGAADEKAVAALVAAGADEAAAKSALRHASGVTGLNWALANARIMIGNFVLGLFSIATFPFRVVAAGFGLLWRTTLQLVPYVIDGIFSVIAALVRLPFVQNLVAQASAVISRVVTTVWAAAAYAIEAAWSAMQTVILTVWYAIEAIAPVITTAIGVAWITLVEAIEGAWIAFTNFIPDVWAVAMFALDAAWTALQLTWIAIVGALGEAWTAFVAFIPKAWELAMFILDAAWTAMQVAWIAVGGLLEAAWVATTEAIELAWIAVQLAVIALWEALPAIAAFVGGAISSAMETAALVSMYAWDAFTMGFGALMAALPGIAAAVAAAVGAILSSPWTIVVLAALTIFAIFRKQIIDIVQSIIQSVVNGFNQLPSAITAPIRRMIAVIRQGIMIARDLLSYLNPFAHHSPSLVEQVAKGVDYIAQKYASLRNIGANFRQAITDLEAFKTAAQRITDIQEQKQFDEVVAIAPGAADEMIKLRDSIKILKGDLKAVGAEYLAQADVVTVWENKLKDANAALDAQTLILDTLKHAADELKNQLDDAKDRLDKLANTPLTGMRAMQDQIFANTMAQKSLRLEILKLEDAGQTVDDLTKKMSALQGEIETLRGQREDLRLAGAGSDVLGPIDQQINALQAQQKAIQDTSSPIADLQKQLDDLGRKGEMLDLQNSLSFDPLTRQIEQASKAYQEMPFDQVMSQITAEQQNVAKLTTKWQAANDAVDAQQAVVNKLKDARDAIQITYDQEKDKLDKLGDAYSGIEQQIQDMTQAMDAFSSSAKSAAGNTPINEQIFNAGQNFDIPGGTSTLGREGGLSDIQDFNKQLQDEYNKTLHDLGKVDVFGPIKDGWKKVWGWVTDNVGPYVKPIWDKIKMGAADTWNNLFGNVDTSKLGGLSGIFDTIGQMWDDLGTKLEKTPLGGTFDTLTNIIKSLGDIAKDVFGYFKTDVAPILGDVVDHVVAAGKSIGGELQNWAPLFGPFIEALGHVLVVVGTVLGAILDTMKVALGLIVAVWSFVWPILVAVIGPIFDMIVSEIRAGLEIARGVITFILAIINGDWGDAWGAILTILDGIWDMIFAVVSGTLKIIWGAIQGTFFGIINFFGGLWTNFLAPIFGGIRDAMASVWDDITGVITGALNIGIKAINFLIRGINKIAEILPGVDFTIPEIPEIGVTHSFTPRTSTAGDQAAAAGQAPGFAIGGLLPQRVGAGFATNGARAIVGEGNALYPEYVVPTDPAHRNSARDLYRQLGAALGADGWRLMAGGGLLGYVTDNPITNTAGDVAGAVGDLAGDVAGALRKGAVTAAFAPFLAAANVAIDQIPVPFIRDILNGMKNTMYNWAKGENDGSDAKTAMALGGIATSATNALIGEAGAEAVIPLNRFYQRLDLGFASVVNAVNVLNADSATRAARWESVDLDRRGSDNTAWTSGFTNISSKLDAVNTSLGNGFKSVSDAVGRIQTATSSNSITPTTSNTTPANKPLPVVTDVSLPNIGSFGSGGMWAEGSHLYQATPNGWSQIYDLGGNLPPGMTMALNMTGSNEHVLTGKQFDNLLGATLPRDATTGNREIHFHGDLSFPNVTNGKDAEDFIANLEALA